MQVGISNAGEVSRVYVGYKCSKKLCSPSPAELVCSVLTYQTMSWFLLPCYWLVLPAED